MVNDKIESKNKIRNAKYGWGLVCQDVEGGWPDKGRSWVLSSRRGCTWEESLFNITLDPEDDSFGDFSAVYSDGVNGEVTHKIFPDGDFEDGIKTATFVKENAWHEVSIYMTPTKLFVTRIDGSLILRGRHRFWHQLQRGIDN